MRRNVLGVGVFLSMLLLADCNNASPSASKLEQSGDLPMTLEELAEWYPPVPESQNAALLLIRAADLHRDPVATTLPNLPVAGSAELPPPGTSLTDETRAAIGQYLVNNDLALATIERAAKLGKSRFPIDLTQGLDTGSPCTLQDIG